MVLNNIDNLYVGSTNALKVYLGSLLIWSLSNDGYDVITTDITSYTGNKSRVYVVDVGKWYMRTIGGNYKEYGVYALSKSADPYVGELAIDNNHEWEYTSNGWVDLGAYSEPEYFLTKTDASNYAIEFGHYWNNSYKMVVDCYFAGTASANVGPIILRETDRSIFELVQYQNGFILDFHEPTSTSSPTVDTGDYTTRVLDANATQIPKDGTRLRLRLTTTKFVVYDYASGSILYNSGTEGATYNYCTTGKYLTGIYSSGNGNTTAVHSIQIVDASNNLVNNFVVKRRDTSGDNEFYVQDTVSGDIFENSTIGANFTYSQVGTLVRPKAYTAMSAPVDVISTDFSSYTGNADRVYVVDINKWYMRTVGGNYTEYGIYASSKSADPYVGELAIIDYHEWEYTSNGWVDLGALPTYTEYEYVQGNGTSYIITDYVPQPNASIEIDCDGFVQSPSGSCVFGSKEVKNNADYGNLGIEYVNGFLVFLYGSTNYSTNNNVIQSRGVVKIDNVGGYVGTTKLVNVSVSIPSDCKGHCGIFCYTETDNTTGVETVSKRGKYTKKIYDVKIYENGTLVRHYIPAIKNGAVGFYETENKVLWDSEVSTPFTVGGSSREVLDTPIKEYAVLPSPVDYDIISTDITSYTGSANRVYVTDVNKWYMRTVEGNYTEYGVYASSKTTDAYIGELAKVDTYVWKYMNYGWSQLGVYSEPEYFLTKNSTAHPSSYIISVGHYWNNGWKMIVDCYFSSTYSGDVGGIIYFNQGASIFEFNQNANGFYLDFHAPTSTSSPTTNTSDYTTRVIQTPVQVIPKDGTRMLVRLTTTRAVFSNYATGSNIYWKGTEGATYNYCTTGKYITGIHSGKNGNTSAVHAIKILDDSDNVVHNFVVKKRDTTGNREFYIQDTVNGDIFENTTGGSFSYSQIGTLIEPKDYPVIPSPVYDIITTDITSYTGSKSRVYVIDVDKWYMRTVGGNYKEYGIYASSKADPYIGELAIIDYHEWEYTENGWVDLGNNSSRLPSGYTELKYVNSHSADGSNSPFITLDYYPKQATVIDAKFRPLGSKPVGVLYYAYPQTDDTRFNFFIGNGASTNTSYWRFPPVNDSRKTSTIINVNTDYVYKSTSEGYWLNNTKIVSRSGTYASQNTARLRVPSSSGGANFNLYYFNISENNTPIHTLVPSMRNSDSEIGLYDMVNNGFYLPDNNSEHPFIAGDVLPYPKEYAVLPAPTN